MVENERLLAVFLSTKRVKTRYLCRQESIEALKDDMIQSILTRVELLCDDMLTEEDQETLPTAAVIYELPVRIFAPLGGGSSGGPTISIADFMFRDERKADAVERIKEVTGKVVSGMPPRA